MEPDQQPGFDAWAVIELFGHQRIAGRVTEQTIGGATLLRVDVPAVGDRPAFTRFYGAGAIYSLTPAAEAIVRLAVLRIQPEPLNVYLPELKQLPTVVPANDRFDDNDFQIEAEAIVRLAVLRIQPEPLNVYLPELKQLPTVVPANDRFDDNDFQIEDDDDPDF